MKERRGEKGRVGKEIGAGARWRERDLEVDGSSSRV